MDGRSKNGAAAGGSQHASHWMGEELTVAALVLVALWAAWHVRGELLAAVLVKLAAIRADAARAVAHAMAPYAGRLTLGAFAVRVAVALVAVGFAAWAVGRIRAPLAKHEVRRPKAVNSQSA